MTSKANLADMYQKFTATTAVFNDAVEFEYIHFGLAGEVGEFLGYIAKHNRDNCGEQFDSDKIKGELGDIMWFVARIAAYHGFTLSEVMLANRDKLIDRQNRDVIRGSGDKR
jgi:NTP pyrophosphatase (non-canonical NTP hydrolase)